MKKLLPLFLSLTFSFSSLAIDEIIIKKEDLGDFEPGRVHKLTLGRTGDVFRANLFLTEPIKLKLYKTRPYHHVMTFYVCHQFNQVADVIRYEINDPVIGSANVFFKCKDGYPTKWRKKAGEFCANAKEHMVKTCKLVHDKYGDNVFK